MRLLVLAALLVAAPAAAAVYTWVDEEGVTHVVDDLAAVPERARDRAREGNDGLRGLWQQGVVEPGDRTPRAGASGRVEGARVRRLVRGALSDLERGETARATVALESVLRLDPAEPEAHWYLALLARQRGRFDAAESHLRAFLAAAGEAHEARRRGAERKLAELADERRLADEAGLGETDAWLDAAHPHFRVHYDAALAEGAPDYASRVLRYLEAAHADTLDRLGAEPDEPLGVMFYGKAAYLRAHRHRFTFQTVGFFDGRIHVVSAAHPAGELRALLFHEYTHAVFRERTGGDRPFWLNEGLAELAERAARSRPALSRSERSLLYRRAEAGEWIPLARLSASFGGLDDGDARAAYLTATAAAAWIEGVTDRSQRQGLLVRLGAGASDDEALRAVLGVDTSGVDAAVRRWLARDFGSAAAALSDDRAE